MKRAFPGFLLIALLPLLSFAPGADECSGLFRFFDVPHASPGAGLVPETAPMKYVIIDPAYVEDEAIEKYFIPFLRQVPEDLKVVFINRPRESLAQRFAKEFSSGKFRTLGISTDSQWTRDYIPEVVLGPDKKPQMVQFEYPHSQVDSANRIGPRIAEAFRLPFYKSWLKAEGGNIMIDEEGVLYSTEKILHANAPHSKAEIEAELKRSLNVKRIEWMPLLHAESTGHIDLYAKYVGSRRMLVADSESPKLKPELDQIADRFKALGFTVFRVKNQGLWHHSYTNSLLANGTAIIPGYADPTLAASHWYYQQGYLDRLPDDAAAAKLYRDLGFKVVQIPSSSVICSGGAVHCLTKQIPAAVDLPQ